MRKSKLTRDEILRLACSIANGGRSKKPANTDSSVTNNHASIGDQFPTIRFVPKHTRMSLVAETPEGMYREGLKAFKYLSSKYAPGLLLNGSTRIGTLHDYRREELGRGIYDPNEGRKRLYHQKTHFTVTAGTPEGDSMKHMGFDLAGDAKLKVDGIKMVREIDHPDLYVWCCASTLDAEISTSLEGAEVCVEIADLGGFFREMTAAINTVRSVKFLGMQEVQYLPVDQPWNGVDLGLSAAFSKEPGAYGAQREIRGVWAPLDDDPIAPFILESSDLSRFCREVEIPS